MNFARLDRRQWLKTSTTLFAGGVLSSRVFGAETSAVDKTAAYLTEASNAVATPASAHVDRQYIHGFETYSGF